MPGPEVRHAALSRRLGERTRPTSAEPVSLDILKSKAQEHFSVELARAEIFQDDEFLNDLVRRAQIEGLPPEAIDSMMASVRRQLTLQANVDVRQGLIDYKAAATTRWEKLMIGVRSSLHEAGEHLGFGVAASVAERQLALVEAKDDMKELLRSALEVQVMKNRMRHYLEMGNPERGDTKFTNVIGFFQRGEMTYNQLIDHPDYLAGLDRIVSKIRIDDSFVLEEGEAPIDASDPEIEEAIRRHLKFVLRTEIVQLAEMEDLSVLSSEEYSAEARTVWQKAKKIGRVVALSGTTWGAGTRLGTKIVIGGSIAFL